MAREHAEWQLPAFARASPNVAATAALLDVLPSPSTNGIGEVYQWVKSVLSVVIV
jgi:hypothetical protein